MLDFSLSTRRNLYFTVQLCSCDVCAMPSDISLHTHTHSDPLRYVFHFRKTMKIVCARCKVNKVNAFIVQQCQFHCAGCTLIARIALETYCQTIYQKDLNCRPPRVLYEWHICSPRGFDTFKVFACFPGHTYIKPKQ